MTPAAVASTIRSVGSSSQDPPWVSTLAAPKSSVWPEVSIWPPAPFAPCAESVPATSVVPPLADQLDGPARGVDAGGVDDAAGVAGQRVDVALLGSELDGRGG